MPDPSAANPPTLLSAPPVGPSGVWARAAENLAAQATSVASNAEAYAVVPNGTEALAPQITEIQGSGALVGQATSNLSAKATTVGDDIGSDSAIALVDSAAALPFTGSGVITSGLNLSANTTTIGNAAQLFGQALLDAAAAAAAVEGNASAGASSASSIGITLAGQVVSIGAGAEITAQADSDIGSQSQTVVGIAESVAAGGLTAGLGSFVGTGTVSVGTDATILATANTNLSAQSTTVNGSGTSLFGLINGSTAGSQAQAGTLDIVEGIDVGTLSVGGNGSINASATTQQQATAFSVKGVTSLGSVDNEGSSASSSDAATIVGAHDTTINIGNSLTKSSFTGSAISSAQAQSIEGNSASFSGLTQVSGADTITLSVGKSITDTLAFNASLTATSNALSVEGLAQSTADNTSGGGTMALRSSDLQVGGNAYGITAIAVNQINSNASAINPLAPPSVGMSGQAEAYASSTTSAINDSSINIGGSAPIKGIATTVVNATATNTGNPSASRSNGTTALSTVNSDTSGIWLSADRITVGDQGSILGQSATQSKSIATSINAPVVAPGSPSPFGTVAKTTVQQTGVELVDYASNIEIGGKGSIDGVSILGGPQGSLSASSPIQVQANSVSDWVSASVESGSMSAGILGTIDTVGPAGFSSLIAGPAGGSISGRSISAIEATAKNVGASASANSTASIGTPGGPTPTVGMVSLGISQVDMQAGLSGKDNITGISNLNSAISSESVQANSNSTGNLISAGISNWSYASSSQPSIAGKASVSGSMSAISQILSTSLAQSVYGSSDSSLATQSTGLLKYDVMMPGNGNLQASASSQTVSKSISVHGSASA